MSTTVMPLTTLTPFLVILVIVLAVVVVTVLVEGYEPPKSAKHSLKTILNGTGGWIGGYLVAFSAYDGVLFSNQFWTSVGGVMTALLLVFGIDLVVLWFRSRRKAGDGDDK